MKKTWILPFILFLGACLLFFFGIKNGPDPKVILSEEVENDPCTSILVTKTASADGSVMTIPVTAAMSSGCM